VNRRFPLAWRLLLAMLLILAVPVGALAGLGWYLRRTVRADVELKVDTTLNLAMNMEESFLREGLAGMKGVAAAAAADPAVVAAVSATVPGGGPVGTALPDLARFVRAFPRTDVLTVVDRQSLVRLRANATQDGDLVSLDGLVERALNGGEGLAYPGLIGPAELKDEGETIQALVDMPITKKSADHRAGGQVDTALALIGVVPVFGADGSSVVGAVIAADILNHDFRIVDEVARWSPEGTPINATIAMDGIRVSTNVRLTDPETGQTELRALGTFYSDRVMQALRQNQEYRGRAEVVDQWQRTIYRPMTDYRGQVIAGAYVGVPEAHFTTVDTQLTRSLTLAILVGGIALLLALAAAMWMVYRGVVRPVRRFAGLLTGGVPAGALNHQTNDEMGDLARVLTRMVERERAAISRIEATAEQLGDLGATLWQAAGRTDDESHLALSAASGSLAAAADLQRGADQTLARLHELAESVKAVGDGVRKQERSVLYIGHVAEEIVVGLKESATHADGTLQDIARLTAGARGALQEVAGFTAGLALLRQQLLAGDRMQALELLKDPSDVLAGIAAQAERAAEAVRSLVMVVQENQARLAFIHDEMGRVSAVVQATAARTQQAGESAGAVIGWMEGMTGTVAAMAGEVLAARSYLESVAEANRSLHELCEAITSQAAQFREAVGQLQAQ
jgi:methyl-accepting chemotaxis protein